MVEVSVLTRTAIWVTHDPNIRLRKGNNEAHQPGHEQQKGLVHLGVRLRKIVPGPGSAVNIPLRSRSSTACLTPSQRTLG